MKKNNIIYIIAILVFSGCKNIGKQEYIYTQTTINGAEESSSIYEKSDSAAYWEALSKFQFFKTTARQTNALDRTPIYFVLKDKKGKTIYFPDAEKEYNEIIQKLYAGDDKFTPENINKAYGGAEFGMSIEQVRDLPTFRNWTVYDDRIVKYNHTLGERKYDVKLLFGNNQLYAIRFTSTSFENAVHLNTSIKNDVDNFKNIIAKVYGEPIFYYGMPSTKQLAEGYTRWVYRWKIANKHINIGVAESQIGAEYLMNAEIIDTQRENALKLDIERMKLKSIEEATKQF